MLVHFALPPNISITVEMFKVRMQGQYGSASDKRLRTVAKEMWKEWGFTRGIMRGYWVGSSLPKRVRDLSPERHVDPTDVSFSIHPFSVAFKWDCVPSGRHLLESSEYRSLCCF